MSRSTGMRAPGLTFTKSLNGLHGPKRAQLCLHIVYYQLPIFIKDPRVVTTVRPTAQPRLRSPPVWTGVLINSEFKRCNRGLKCLSFKESPRRELALTWT